MSRFKEWDWTIDAYKEHIKEDKPMRSSAIHYDNGKEYDVIDIIQDFDLGFNKGNVIKYLCRAGKKDDELQDLYKAKDYIEREIEFIRSKRNKETEQWKER